VALVSIGKVVRAIGLKGFVGVSGTDGSLGQLEQVVLERAGTQRRLAVVEARPQGKLWAVCLEGISDRTAAEGLVGWAVLAERDQLGEAGEGSHYWTDLEGLPVETLGGEQLGTVTGLYETGGVDVLVVTGGRGEVLIPLAPYVEVDVKAKRIVVDPPDGLLDGPGGT
jgi:16S rRNA processing protein RimM